MANTLKIKRGTNATTPQGQLAEPLFTTDTYDLYIGKGGALGNQRFQKYIASGTSSQFLKGDGSLDSTTYQATSEKGQNNGYASLDAGGKIPASQLPSSVIEYKGTWNASTNTPTLADGTGDTGDVYIVSVGGTQNLGSGAITFAAGDWVMYNGAIWQKSTGSNAVASVNGQTGVVTITFDQLSPMTTLGDIIYGGASGAGTRLAGNTAASKRFLIQTGDGTNSAAPSWGSIAAGDVPTLNQNTTGSAATLTTARTFTIGATGKTFDGSANVSWTLAEIGAQATLTNPVTGTGTTNYIPKFTGASTIGNSNLINDASGNLGLGVTPSAWIGDVKAIQIGDAGSQISASNSAYSGGNNLWLSSNSYQNSSVQDIYARSATAGMYWINGNIHKWFNAPSGTAGNAISFTQAMTLFSTGNLAVGGTSDNGSRLNVTGAATFSSSVRSNSHIIVSDGSSANVVLQGYINNALRIAASGSGSSGGSRGDLYVGAIDVGSAATFSSSVTAINVISTSDANGNAFTARARSSDDTYAQLIFQNNAGTNSNAVIGVEKIGTNGGQMYFYTKPDGSAFAERMRITSGGNVGIGTTNPNVYGNGFTNQFTVSTTSGYANISVAGSSGNSGGIDFGNQSVRHAGVYGLDGSNLGFYTNGSNSGNGVNERMRITSGGDITTGGLTAGYLSAANRGNVTIYGSTDSIMSLRSGASGAGYFYHTGTHLEIYNTNSGYIKFATENAEVLRLTKEAWLYIQNRTAAPAANPVTGGYLYCESGALKYRGSSGTVTTIANA